MNWEIIGPDLLESMNHMFLHQMVTPQKKHEIIICLPKDNGAHTPAGYRPITLRTTDEDYGHQIASCPSGSVAQNTILRSPRQHHNGCGNPSS
jgi:hypothetical protein